MGYLWTTFLYSPLLNALVALYNNFAGQNLGVAIIELVVVIRIFMLPLTVISERARARYESLREKLSQVEDMYKNDPIAKKEMMRKLLERNKIKPWAKAMVLSVLFIVLIILYWVFLVAVSDNDFTGLYSWNRAPDFLDTNFLGFNLNARSFIWSFAVALVVHLSIWAEQKNHKDSLSKADLIYRLMFPVSIFIVLYLLPMAKSLFILTSLIITVIIIGVRGFFAKDPESGVGPFKPAFNPEEVNESQTK